MARAAHSGLPILALAGLTAALAACGSSTPATTPTPSSPTATATVQPTATPPPSATPTPATTATGTPTALAAIVIEKPAAGTTVHSPFHVTGTANTFEAVFRLEVQTPSGQVLSNQQVQATSGTGTRGTFDATVTVSAMGPIKLVAYEVSPKDGSRVNEVSVSVTVG